jgi:beta-lactamase class A
MARLFALLADGRAVSPAADSQMVDMLVHNEDLTMLQRLRRRRARRPQDGLGGRGAHRVLALVPAVARRRLRLTRENATSATPLDAGAHLVMARMGQAIVAAWPRAAVKPAS